MTRKQIDAKLGYGIRTNRGFWFEEKLYKGITYLNNEEIEIHNYSERISEYLRMDKIEIITKVIDNKAIKEIRRIG